MAIQPHPNLRVPATRRTADPFSRSTTCTWWCKPLAEPAQPIRSPGGRPVDTLQPPVYPSALDGACPPPPHAPFTHLTLYPRKGPQTIPSNIQVPLVLPALRPPTHPSLTPIRATTRLHSTWIGLSGQGEGGACGRGGRAKKNNTSKIIRMVFFDRPKLPV